MMYPGLVAALLIALALTFIAVFFLRQKGPWGSAWAFFLVLFLALWTVAIYVAPAGPVYYGVAWVPILIAGVLLVILLIASMPDANHGRDENIKSPEAQAQQPYRSGATGRFFWILIVLLAVAIVIGMLNPQKAL